MPHDPKKLLWDIQAAGRAIEAFAGNKTLADYEADALVRSAIERQFIIIGEAFVRMKSRHGDLFNKLDRASAYIDFRNIIAHQYDGLDHKILFSVVKRRLPQLIAAVEVELMLHPHP